MKTLKCVAVSIIESDGVGNNQQRWIHKKELSFYFRFFSCLYIYIYIYMYVCMYVRVIHLIK